MSEIVSLYGQTVPQERVVRAGVVEALERALEQARSGEVQGIALAMLHADGLGSYALCGCVGAYSLLGAATAVRDALSEEVRG